MSNLARSREFYQVQLGMTGAPAPGGYAVRCGGGTSLYLLESTDYPGQARWPLASFAADDLDTVVTALRARGVEMVSIADGPNSTDERGIAELPGMRIAWITDPDDQVLSIFELTGA